MAAENNIRIAGFAQRPGLHTPSNLRDLERYVSSYGGQQVVGTPEQVADYLIRLSEMGLDGTSISFMGFWEEELERFTREVMPLLVQAGLRHEFRPPQIASG